MVGSNQRSNNPKNYVNWSSRKNPTAKFINDIESKFYVKNLKKIKNLKRKITIKKNFKILFMLEFRKYLHSFKIIKKFPLYLKKNNHSLRYFAQKKNSKIVKNTTIKLLKNKGLNFFFDNFDRKYLALYLQFYLDQKIYFKICQNEIYKFIKNFYSIRRH